MKFFEFLYEAWSWFKIMASPDLDNLNQPKDKTDSPQ
jgi:hypothetical protein